MSAVVALIWIGVFWVAPFIVASKIGTPKGRRGWIYALLGGWVGVIILACIGPAVDPALAAKERHVRELELDARLAVLEAQKTTTV